MFRDKLELNRVCYGKKEQTILLREYQTIFSSAVGTISEFVEWIKNNNLEFRTLILKDSINNSINYVYIDDEFNFRVE